YHHYPIRQKYLDILKVLCCHLDTTHRTALLRQAYPKLVISLVECVMNILRENVPLSRRYKSKLRKHAPSLRKIIAPQQHCKKYLDILKVLSKTATIADKCVGAGRSNDNYLNTVQTPGSEVLRLDDEVNKILNSSELDDRQKYSMYQQVLQRFLHYKKQSSEDDEVGNELLLPTVDKTSPPLHSITTNGDGEVMPDLHIMNSVPPSLCQNARNLMNSLRGSGNIDWNKLGMITVDGVRARGVWVLTTNTWKRERVREELLCAAERENRSDFRGELISYTEDDLSGRAFNFTSRTSFPVVVGPPKKYQHLYLVNETVRRNKLRVAVATAVAEEFNSSGNNNSLLAASDTSLLPIPGQQQQQQQQLASSGSASSEEKSVALLTVLCMVGKITFDKVYRRFRQAIKCTRKKWSRLNGRRQRYQIGAGIGSYLKGLFRRVLPLVKRGAKSVGKDATCTSAKIMDDVMNENRPFREVLSKCVHEGGDNLKRKVVQIMNKIIAPDEQEGEEVGG
ncbi:hypothetical protein TSAR_003802, partial [Trichomalopsis sarcophagae]